MGTCIREGQSYKRHWWNDEGICELCGHKSPWALYIEQERLEQLSGSTRLTPQDLLNNPSETVIEMADRVLNKDRETREKEKSNVQPES